MNDGGGRDLAVLVVSLVGSVTATEDVFRPFRLLDADGSPVGAVDVFLAEMQAAGRSAATQRSYALDLLRWLRFCWAIEVPWDQATSCEGRDFIRWMMSTVKPARPHWRTGQVPDPGRRCGAGAHESGDREEVIGNGICGLDGGALRERAPCVLRHPPGGGCRDREPVSAGLPVRSGGCASQSDGPFPIKVHTGNWSVIGPGSSPRRLTPSWPMQASRP